RALVQRAGHRHGRGDATDGVAQGEPRAGRTIVLSAGDRHDAGHRLELAVEGRGRSLRPGTAEPGDGAVDEARVEGRQRLVAEAEAVHDAAAEVLPHHVGTDHEARADLDRLRTAQVEGEAALVAVHGQEGRG